MTTAGSPDIQIGLVGLGHVAAHQSAAIELTEGINLAAACDIDPDTATHLPKSVEFYASFDKMLSDGRCNAILISAPNREHYQLGCRTIDAGNALVLEKPAVETREQFDDIVARAADKNVFLYVAMHAAFGAEILWLSRQLERNSLNLGDLRGFEASFFDPYVVRNQLVNGATSLGGSWSDSGANALSILARLVDLRDLRVSNSRMTPSDGLDCSETEGLVELESSTVHGNIHTSWLTGRDHKSTRLFFEEDEILLDHSAQKVFRGPSESQQVIYSYDGPLARLTNHYVGVFADLVRHHSMGRGNIDVAMPNHRIFFTADEIRQ
jgi:D-galactose 1-dehydrogenase